MRLKVCVLWNISSLFEIIFVSAHAKLYHYPKVWESKSINEGSEGTKIARVRKHIRLNLEVVGFENHYIPIGHITL